MSYSAESPPPPLPEPSAPPEPPILQGGRRLKRPYICASLALLFAAGLVASAFWPWLRPLVGDEMSGWDVYRTTADTGDNAFVIGEAFRAGFSPLFTGLSVVIAGALLGAAAVLLLAAPRAQQPSLWAVHRGVATAVLLIGLVSAVPSLVNLFSVTMTQPRPYLIQPAGGLIGGVFLACIGEILLILGATGSAGWKKRRASG